MARRPIFVPGRTCGPFVRVRELEFEWHPGVSLSQKQRSIASLHKAATAAEICPALEISTKSPDALGVELSAFNLQVVLGNGMAVPLECAFQSAKVFELGGPYLDLLGRTPKEAKTDPRLRESGELLAFEFDGRTFPLVPQTAFYDWLYINAVCRRGKAEALCGYQGFTDIEFNPQRSLNCQARAAALVVAFCERGILQHALSAVPRYLDIRSREQPEGQLTLL